MGELTESDAAALAAVMQGNRGHGEFAYAAELYASGVHRATLVGLYDAGWLDCVESTAAGDVLDSGTIWTLTPWGAERLGVHLVEATDEQPRWVSRAAPEPENVVMPPHPRHRRIDKLTKWAQERIWRRKEEQERAAELAREQLKRAAETQYMVDPRTDRPVVLFGQVVKVDPRLVKGPCRIKARKRKSA